MRWVIKMKKVIFIGKKSSGKTTLINKLTKNDCPPLKTNTLEYVKNYLDTPGDYLENKYYYALILSAYECDLVVLVHRAGDDLSLFPAKFASILNRKTIGVITSLDVAENKETEEILSEAGVEEIFKVSLDADEGVSEFKKYIDDFLAQ